MAYDLSKVVVTSSPHIKADDDTRSLMLDVLIALVPALAVAIYTFGVRALIHVIIAMVSCAVFETIYNKIVKHENTVGDLSCFVTGVLIAFNIPVAAPLWLTVFGGLFGIVIVKMLFGGIGKNFMNPALGARAFMMASWAGFMTTWTAPHVISGRLSGASTVSSWPLSSAVNFIASATLCSSAESEKRVMRSSMRP